MPLPPEGRVAAAARPLAETSRSARRAPGRHRLTLADRVSTRARHAMLMALDGSDFGIAEMEALGLSLRVINLLEEKLGIIWLSELLAYGPDELRQRVAFLGQSGVDEIMAALSRFDQLGDCQAQLAAVLKPGRLPIN